MYITPFERTYVYLLVEIISGAFEYWNIEGIFTFVLFENTENFVQQKRLYFGKKMNIDIGNHSNGYLTLSVST